jgi:hypothetical protein
MRLGSGIFYLLYSATGAAGDSNPNGCKAKMRNLKIEKINLP